jgi:hypothetical protein
MPTWSLAVHLNVRWTSELFSLECVFSQGSNRQVGLFDWLDPTRSWESVPGRAPDLGPQSLQIASLPFGAPLESARILGRPDELEWRRLRGVCVVYATGTAPAF